MHSDSPVKANGPFLVGYARVSIEDQDNARQKEELTRYGCGDIFEGRRICDEQRKPHYYRAMEPRVRRLRPQME
jgi:hypothetical protein